MRRNDLEIRDRELLSGMLDLADILHLAIKNEPYPYVVPLNFGYEWEDDTLVFYFHCAKEGLKLDLLRRDGHVTVNAAAFISYAHRKYRGHYHDYRSVTASGVAEEISPDDERFLHAHELLMAHNRREMQPEDYPVMKQISIWQIRCRVEDVTGKAEIVPKTLSEIPFAEPETRED